MNNEKENIMNHAKILEGSSYIFDWERGKKSMNNLEHEDGSVNWGAALYADPGATKCPNCEEYYWAEAELLECPECGTQWSTFTKEAL